MDWGLITGEVPLCAEIIQSTPAALNEKILKGDLEVSAVSSLWYAANQKDFVLFPELSISSESGVQSVLLFSRVPMSELAGRWIAVTGEGRTTPALLEILCRRRYGFMPWLVVTPVLTQEIPNGFDAMLLIGDEALIAKHRINDTDVTVTDLAEEWRRWTGLGFVFALWAARRDFCTEHPTEARRAHETILQSKEWGISHTDAIIAEARKRTGLPGWVLTSYFSGLRYVLDADLIGGLNLYLNYAHQCGLLGAVSPVQQAEFVGAVR